MPPLESVTRRTGLLSGAMGRPDGLAVALLGGLRVSVRGRTIEPHAWTRRKARGLVCLLELGDPGAGAVLRQSRDVFGSLKAQRFLPEVDALLERSVRLSS